MLAPQDGEQPALGRALVARRLAAARPPGAQEGLLGEVLGALARSPRVSQKAKRKISAE
jgi:hypothetical protein